MSYDLKLMDHCLSHALKNPIQSRGRNTISRMAALISGKYLSNGPYPAWVGLNQYKTHPMMYRFSKDPTKIYLHAEIDAINSLISFYNSEHKIRDILSSCDIYVSRVLKDGTSALAKPCSSCFGALTHFGIRNVYWTT